MHKTINIFFGFLAVTCILLYIWSLNKGFDMADEAYSLLLLKSVSFETQFHFNNLFIHILPENILFIRIITLVFKLISSFILSIGCYFFYKRNFNPIANNQHFYSIALVLLLSFIIFIHPATLSYLSYNTLNIFSISISVGLILIAFSVNKSYQCFIWFFIAGLIAGFIPFFKITSAVFIPWAMLFILFTQKISSGKFSYWACSLFLLGCIVTILFYFLFVQSIKEFTDSSIYFYGKFFKHDPEYNSKGLIIWILKSTSLFIGYFLSGVLWYYLVSKIKFKSNFIQLIIILLSTIWLIMIKKFTPYDELEIGIMISAPYIFLLGFSIAIATFGKVLHNYLFLCFIIFFLSIPFVGSFGTDNRIEFASSFYLMFWSLIILLLLFQIEDRVFTTIFAISILFSTFLFFTTPFQKVYWMDKDGNELINQKFTLDDSNQKILLDSFRINTFKDIKHILSNQNLNLDSIKFLVSTPTLLGYVYLLNSSIFARTDYAFNYKQYFGYLSDKNIRIKDVFLLEDPNHPFNKDVFKLLSEFSVKPVNYAIIQVGGYYNIYVPEKI